MSRHDLIARPDAVVLTRGVVGWDRPLRTFFAQLFSFNEEEEEEAHLWVGTHAHELDTAAAAIAIVRSECLIPEGLAATLETERLATLGTFDSDLQADMKTRFVQPSSPEGDV